MTDRVLHEHLQGEIVAGVYPLVDGDRCHFVALDFDGAGWQEDVAAFAESTRAAGLPVAVERSRSGNGAHAWFFFSGAVSASAARQMASYLLTEAMSLRAEGFDDPRLDTLVLAMPVAWRGTVVQYAGRLHRLHAGKTEVRILDYLDRNVPVLAKMFAKRLRGYRALGYAQDSETSNATTTRELSIEYDDDDS